VSEQGKKVGIIGGVLMAIGAAVAHGADDCARVGARSAAEVGAVRGATNAGDDIAKLGARGAHAEGLAAEGVGVRGARGLPPPTEVPGLKLGGEVAVADEAAVGKPWRDLAEEMGQELAPNALEQVLDVSNEGEDEDDPSDAGPRPSPAKGFALVSLVPSDSVGFALAFGGKAQAKSLDGFANANRPSKTFGLSVPLSRIALHSALGASPNPIARFVLGYQAGDDARSLATPDPQFSIRLSEIASRCLSAGASCVLLVCENLDATEQKPCASRSRELIDGVVAAKPRTLQATVAELGKQRKERGVSFLSLYAPVRVDGKLKLARSPSTN
jgi:hypothetical protein